MDTTVPPQHAVPIIGRDFYDRARATLTLDVPPALNDHTLEGFTRGDLDQDPQTWKEVGITPSRPAAVLVPVVDHAEPGVLLTMRTTDLSSHAGQIAFPGGKIEKTDASPVAAALREAHEEIGLDGALIEPIGYLDLYLTFSGFRILPVVARVIPNYALRINASEVADAFEVPLSFVMDAANHKKASRDWKGITRYYYEMPYRERYIWGVTAGILRNLYEKLYA
jgi:8-oxo-dGTP pyrophosphatase MutT (NUDIX family)